MGNKTSAGVISDGWNLVRAELDGTKVRVFANPQFPDVVPGYGTKIVPLAPRIEVDISDAPRSGAFGVAASGGAVSVDYISAVPLDWVGRGPAAAGH